MMIFLIISWKVLLLRDLKGCSNSSLLPYLETASDSRVRLSKLIGETTLGRISMWIAFPSSNDVVPGAEWYNQVWEKNHFGGYEHVDAMISLSPCSNYDKIFLQVGAHLGVFPLVAAYRGCVGIGVEPIPAATHFARISAAVNNWNEDQFLMINAASSSRHGGFTWYDPKGIVLSADSANTAGKVQIPLVTVDAVNDQYGYSRQAKESRIAFVMIDVEGYEQDVLLGSKRLIEKKTVLVFQIEVWTQIASRGVVSSFPGLQLLVDNGYHLYTTTRNSQMNFTSCDPLTNRLPEIPTIFNESCRNSPLPADQCLAEVFALRSDIPPLRQWFVYCPKQTIN